MRVFHVIITVMTANLYDEMKTTTTHTTGSDMYMYISMVLSSCVTTFLETAVLY